MNITKLLRAFAVSATIVSAGLGTSAQAAGSATYALTPASTTQNSGATFTVSVYENSGAEAVNGVQADLTYNASSLEFVSASTGAFTTCPVAPKGGAGKVSVECALLGSAVTGNQLVASITFKVLAGSGSANISIAQTSKIVSATTNQDIWNQQAAVTSVVMTTPVPVTPAPTPAPSPAPVAVRKTTAVNSATTTNPTPVSSPEAPESAATTTEEQTPIVISDGEVPPAVVTSANGGASKAPWYLLGVGLGVMAALAAMKRKQLMKAIATLRQKMSAEEATKAAIAPAAVAVKATKKAVKKPKAVAKKPTTKKK